jgi:hypothetical protein
LETSRIFSKLSCDSNDDTVHRKFSFFPLRRSALQNLKNSGIKGTRWAEDVAESRQENAYRMLGKPEGKGLLGRPNCRCEDNIKMVLTEA